MKIAEDVSIQGLFSRKNLRMSAKEEKPGKPSPKIDPVLEKLNVLEPEEDRGKITRHKKH